MSKPGYVNINFEKEKKRKKRKEEASLDTFWIE